MVCKVFVNCHHDKNVKSRSVAVHLGTIIGKVWPVLAHW